MRRQVASIVVGTTLALTPSTSSGQAARAAGNLAELLADGHVLFGIFSGPKTPEQGAAMAGNEETDFVFYSLETGPFDIPQMVEYMGAMRSSEEALDVKPHPVALRIPPIRDGHDAALEHARQGLEAGVAALVFPHVESGEDAELAVSTMRAAEGGLWPLDGTGSLVNMLLIEDKIGVANAREIVSTPGVSIVFPGPGDLSRAYERDAEAIEGAIQTVLAACKEFDVPCGITAGAEDIGMRIEQGFRVIIVTEAEALSVGLRAAGRSH